MSRFKQFVAGIGYIGRGFRFFFGHKILWPYGIIPTAINIAVLITLLAVMMHYFGGISDWIVSSTGIRNVADSGLGTAIWNAVISVFLWVGKVILFAILLIVALIVFFIFATIFAGPFYETLSLKVEEIRAGEIQPFNCALFFKYFWRALAIELQKSILFFLIPLLLLILYVLPAIGAAIYVMLAGVFACYDMGFNFVDFSMSRKRWKFMERMRAGWRHKYLLTGFGLITIIPLLPYIFGAPMAVGGTLIYLDFEFEKERAE